MELLELISPPTFHKEEDPECPFCPKEKKDGYTTIDGLGNNGGTLGDNMNNCTIDGGAKPKEEPDKDRKDELKKPDPIGVYPHDSNVGAYSCQAHHLISGKQALSKNSETEKFEQWIKASHGTIEFDTGYSVNNFDNGIWLPSVPTNTIGIKGAWGKMDREKIANWIMKKTQSQFHCGGHHIPEKMKDENGKWIKVPDDERLHKAYDEWLIDWLRAMSERILLWSDECFLCKEGDKKKEKLQPSDRVNEALDRLSNAAKRHITGDRASWDIFISTLAFMYHYEVCPHKHDEDADAEM